ncbi:hypothetical protein J437_LFUL012564 [Ladona fulva]|uniref:Uncharacterized protein n=1 Tax=Ladona fulva TaxID=123851 RepID=A0A8K0KIR0_LADFU|nr:hypothetical protein J437_LFUL012564 [Ladona fulva]
MELHVNIPPDGSGGGGPCSSLPSPTGSTSSAGEGSTGSAGTGISSSRPHRLAKRPSVDSGIHLGTSSLSSSTSGQMNMGDNGGSNYGGLKFRGRNGRETPKLSRFDRSMSLPLNSPVNIVDSSTNDSISSEGHDLSRMSPVRRMDFALCEVVTGPRSESPIIDVEAVSDEESSEAKQSLVGEQDVRVLALAEQIIAAIPERIKNESEEMMSHEPSPQPESASSSHSNHTSLSEPFLEPMMDEPPSSSFEPAEFNFEFNIMMWELPAPVFLQHPLVVCKVPAHLLLILRLLLQQLLISYAYFKQMTKAAMYRSYCEHKRFKKSQEAAVCIQNYYRNYREQERGRQSREGTPTGAGLKRTYSQRRQHQAARKIQQFMRQSKNKLQRERALAAERERQEALSSSTVDVQQRLHSRDNLASTDLNRVRKDPSNVAGLSDDMSGGHLSMDSKKHKHL